MSVSPGSLDPAIGGKDPTMLLADVLEGACVLIVDDEQTNVALLERMLRQVGVAEIHGTNDPQLAVERCREVGADLVLLDLHMPRHDGFAVMAELADSLPEDAFVPVLVLTADSTTEIRDRALQAGASDFLTKPLDRMEVILRVRNLLQTRALYLDVQQRNARLRAELDRREAEEWRLEQERRDRLARIDEVLRRRGYTMVFQPIAGLASGEIVGAEALARFTDEPYRPPNEWFDEASTVGRSQELEIAAVTAAVASLDELPEGVFLALNLSPETAVRPELAEALREVPPERIVVELTEHTRVDDYAPLLAGLEPLREGGFRIAVDDAGAGYAGLRHVLRLQPDMLKLDIDLIRGIDVDPVKRALSAALVRFAHETGAVIIAEGIETAAELETLRSLGVEWGQGYHLARPASLPLPHSPLRALTAS